MSFNGQSSFRKLVLAAASHYPCASMMPENDLDPRVKRTRQMLFQALRELLAEKSFEAITVQDLAERSTVNRGTIYAHYRDKFALLEGVVQADFQAVFEARMAGVSGTCSEGVRQLILAVCDYLGPLLACSEEHQRPFEPVVEATVRTIVRGFLLEELRRSQKVGSCSEAQLRATAASWAICGTVLEWSRTRATPPEELAGAVLPLVAAGLFL